MMTTALTELVNTNRLANTVVLLPVPQFKESDGLVVDVAKFDSAVATVVAPPYQAMSMGDTVTLSVKIFLDGSEVDTITKVKTLDAENINQPIEWTIAKSDLAVWFDCSMKASYRIIYAEPTDPTGSEEQTLDIIDSSPGRAGPSKSLMPAPAIKGFEGEMLDPEAHPNGITILVPMYVDIKVDNTVLLYATGKSPFVKSLRVDQTNIDSKILSFSVGYPWLVANKGREVHFMYQYASVGSAGSSMPLSVKLREPRYLPLPIIQDVIPEGEDGENKGYLLGSTTLNGITIDIPPEASIGDGETTKMIFDGYKPGGHYIANPSFGNDRRFKILKEYVPANLGKRLEVYYQVTPPGEEPYDSIRFDLQIRDIEKGWPPIQIKSPPAPDNVLSLATVTDVVTFKLNSFHFFAQGHRVRITATGVLQEGGKETFNLREGDDEVIDEDEYNEGIIYATLPRDYLMKLKKNLQFDVKVYVSFDSGFSYKSISMISPTLVE